MKKITKKKNNSSTSNDNNNNTTTSQNASEDDHDHDPEVHITSKKCGIQLFCGNSNKELGELIAHRLGIKLGKCIVTKFSNGETNVTIEESTRDHDVFLMQSTATPNVNDHLMELLIMIDAFKRASSRRISVLIPCFAYARQDKKDRSRAPISAKLIANLIEKAGADRVITLDLHASQIQGFFDIPVDNLYAEQFFVKYIRENIKKDIVIVSPDAGGVKRAKSIADQLHADLAIIHKERKKANEVESMILVGDVSKKVAVLVDDMADTLGTFALASETLIKNGATEVYACCTHPVLSGSALEKLENCPITNLIVSNSIRLDEKFKKCSKIKVIDLSALFAQVIQRTHEGKSISSLFHA